MFAAWLKSHQQGVWWLVFLCSSVPGLRLARAWHDGGLGPNPLETLLHTTGRSALVLLALTLAITPLRKLASTLSRLTRRRYGKRIADWNWLVRLRRMLGLWCFTYALAHACLFLELDLDRDWLRGWVELREKPYLGAGAVALALLFPLAMTSTSGMMRRLGRHWRRLHMLTYAVAVLGLLHFWWLVKPGSAAPLPDTLALGALLGYRLLLAAGVLERWQGHDGSEAPERGGPQGAAAFTGAAVAPTPTAQGSGTHRSIVADTR
jgi:sulfoxide reductase heme-binding subunit YedZ